MEHKLTPLQAKRIFLAHQGLIGKNKFQQKQKGVHQVIEHLGYIQIDTISVVARAHHHTLWSRVKGYQPEMVDQLQKQKEIFEYWSHAAAFLPMRDFRYSLINKEAIASGQRHWYPREPKVMQFVLDRIKTEGPLQSKDFKSDNRNRGIWYQWKPTKRALEQLFMEGELMIAHRHGFQKVYDLTERVLPEGIDTSNPDLDEFCRHLVRATLKASGLASIQEIGYLRKGPIKPQLAKTIQNMLEEGEIVACKVQGIEKSLFYAFPETLENVSRRISNKTVHLLSPFDNSVIQRKRLQQFFDFDYQIECYVPAPKRQFGYYCLPILWGDEFIGRLDAKADRKSKTFILIGLWIDISTDNWKKLIPSLSKKIQSYATFNGCERIEIKATYPKILKTTLSKFF